MGKGLKKDCQLREGGGRGTWKQNRMFRRPEADEGTVRQNHGCNGEMLWVCNVGRQSEAEGQGGRG